MSDTARPTSRSGERAVAVCPELVVIRPVLPTDRHTLTALCAEPAPDSVLTGRRLAGEVDRLCRPDSARHLAVVATRGGNVVGAAAVERTGRTAGSGNLFVYVAESREGRGVGTLLVDYLTVRSGRLRRRQPEYSRRR